MAERDRIAQEQLGLDDSWTIVYTATSLEFMYDCAAACDLLPDDYFITLSDVEGAIEKSVIEIDIPKGWRLVGLRPCNEPEVDHSKRKYGLVDFSGLGCDAASKG